MTKQRSELREKRKKKCELLVVGKNSLRSRRGKKTEVVGELNTSRREQLWGSWDHKMIKGGCEIEVDKRKRK